jgi:hypothetical protein
MLFFMVNNSLKEQRKWCISQNHRQNNDKFKEEKTNREARGSTTSSFRGELKVLSNRKVKERKTKKQRTSTSMDEIGDKSQIS